MNTKLLKSQVANDIALAGEILKTGGLVAIPTETVYGLAANALNPEAVKKIFLAKGRPGDNPLIVHISDYAQMLPLVTEIPPKARMLAKAFWPGPLTMILPKTPLVPSETSGGLNTVAIRFPSNKIAAQIIAAAGCPLAAPSANISGKPSPTTFSHVREDLFGKVDAIVDGGDCNVGLESTVITFATSVPCLLRPGGITVEQIESVIGAIEVDRAVEHHLGENAVASSPGMKYKHYAPAAQIIMSVLSYVDYLKLFEQDKEAGALCFEGEEAEIPATAVSYGKLYDGASQAHGLFSALHELDVKEIRKVYARAPQKRGVGLAVYNRLIRAAGFQILKPETEIIGLTGQSGAGKTTVASALAKCGAAVIDCDQITKEEDTYTAACKINLQKIFGHDILTEAGMLRRQLLATRAFATPETIKQLNEITLPVISQKIKEKIQEHKEAGSKCIVLDAPTLFEAKADRLCTKILVVTAAEDLRLQRIMKRDSISLQDAQQRLRAQGTEEYYTNRADAVIRNTGTKNLMDEVEKLWNEWSSR